MQVKTPQAIGCVPHRGGYKSLSPATQLVDVSLCGQTAQPFVCAGALLRHACNTHMGTNRHHQVLLAYVPPAMQRRGGWYEAMVLQGTLVREVAALAWYYVRGWLC